MKARKGAGKTTSCATAAAAVAGAAVGAGLALYGSRLRTMASIRCESNSGTPYNLYSMDVSYSYDLDRLIQRGLDGNQKGIDAMLAEALPFLPVSIQAPDFGCSAFALTNGEQALMGRNYDFSRDTSAMLVRCAPRDGYKSIAFCALDNLGANDPLASLKARCASLAAPFVCLDGVNEKGVSIAVLTLDSEPTQQRTGKPVISTSVAIRLVLDRAATTQQAVDLLQRYDMFASSGRDYHFYISDAQGDGRVVEYDCNDPRRPMVVTPMRAITNFFALYKDQVKPNGKNGIYGHGRERYDAIEEVLTEFMGPVGKVDASADEMKLVAWEALRAAAQEPNPNDITSNTQWSIVFSNTDYSAEMALRRNWEEVHRVTVSGGVTRRTE